MEPCEDERFQLLLAKWTLGRLSSEDVPELCADLLTFGYDTPTLRILAGLPSAELDEVPDLLPCLFREMDLSEPPRIQAAWLIARDIARQIQEEVISPYEGACGMAKLTSDFQPLLPVLKVFVGLWSEWDDYGIYRRPDYDSDIRTEAVHLLTMGPPPEPGTGSEIDRLVTVAESQRRAGTAADMSEAINLLVKKIPAGHLLPPIGIGEWAQIGSHRDVLAMLVHTSLPFAFIRCEYRQYAQPVIDKIHVCVADISDADMEEISITQGTIKRLAGREVTTPEPLPWLSVNQILGITS